MNRTFIGLTALLLQFVIVALSLNQRVMAGALWGPATIGSPTGKQVADVYNPMPPPPLTTVGTEFRWSFYDKNLPMQDTTIGVAFDDSFNAAFKALGRMRVTEALKTWQNQLANAGRNNIDPVPAMRFDLESVALHELGHALGLSHPNIAAMVIPSRNWQSVAAFPWLDGSNTQAAAGTEVMNSTVATATRKRDLTTDDLYTLKYLYDAGNRNTPAPAEKADVADGLVPGMGAFTFDPIQVDDANALPPKDFAIEGLHLGQNIDIFAMDINGAIELEIDEGSGQHQSREVTRGPNNEVLAYTTVRFSWDPAKPNGPGIFNGSPNNPQMHVSGIDIVFNTNADIKWFVGVPEPTAGTLSAIGIAMLLLRRRAKHRRP